MNYMGMDSITQKHFEELDNLFEQFISSHNEVWLFGAGLYGKAFYRYLQECGVQAIGFVISNPESQETEDGKPILNIKQFRDRYNCSTEKIGMILSVDEKYYDEILPELMFLRNDLWFLKKLYKEMAVEKFSGTRRIYNFGFQLVDHCNLSCYGCGAFSPLAEEFFYDYDDFVRDINCVKKIFGDKIEKIDFNGGEVLLHPRLLDFVETARDMFTNIQINLLTNGINAQKQSESFWDRLSKAKATICWTLYPIKYQQFEETLEKIKKYNVTLYISGDSSETSDKTSWYLPFSLKGDQKIHDFLLCSFNRCSNTLRAGILYHCCQQRTIHILNKRFGTSLPGSDNEYINITEVDSANTIYEFQKKRASLCNYCAIRKRKNMGKWLPSRCKKEEWILT